MDPAATCRRSSATSLRRVGARIDVGCAIGEKSQQGRSGRAAPSAGRVRGGQMNTSTINALGLTLAHFLWEGAAIALVLAALRGSSARARYAAACAALAAMPIACVATFLLVREISH